MVIKIILQEKILSLKNLYPFHMPGHKRNKKFVSQDLLSLDFTEIYGLDNLHDPKDIIDKAQVNCAKIYDCEKSFFVVNGASCAVLATIFGVCDEKDEIIVMRNSHKCLYNALELRDLKTYYLYGKNFFGVIDYNELDLLLKKNNNIKAVFVTSPTYEGFCLDIKKIVDLVHKYDKILIVDEAHGSHFIFSDFFPLNAIKAGADIVINSLHKTLPCLTQSAVLHVNSKLIDIDRIKKYLSMFQTTSPSYIFMSVMDNSLNLISKPGFYNSYIKKLLCVRDVLYKNKIFALANKNFVKKLGFHDLDITKLLFFMSIKNIKTKNLDIEKVLRDEFLLQIEMRNINYFLALSTIADTDYGFDLLINAISELEKRFDYENNYSCFDSIKPVELKRAMSLKKAASKNKKYVLINKSINRVCGEYIILYPPGISLIIPGEIINKNIVDAIKIFLENGLNLIGLDKNFLKIIVE